MIRYVPLDKLPEGLEFPSRLQERIWYEPDKRRLAFEGFMYKADFDQLLRLSRDGDFQRAVHELFRRCVDDPPPAGRMLHKLVIATLLLGAILCLGMIGCIFLPG